MTYKATIIYNLGNNRFSWRIDYNGNMVLHYGQSPCRTYGSGFSTEDEATRDRRNAGWVRDEHGKLYYTPSIYRSSDP